MHTGYESQNPEDLAAVHWEVTPERTIGTPNSTWLCQRVTGDHKHPQGYIHSRSPEDLRLLADAVNAAADAWEERDG